MIILGILYENGVGIARDQKAAFQWALKAAEAGNPSAMAAAAYYYLTGQGVAKDPAMVKRWYERSANAGEAEGMYGLALVYANGTGTAADPRLAAQWMIRAIRGGSIQAAAAVMRAPNNWSAAFRQDLQMQLRAAGVYQGKVDDNIGAETRRAIRALSARDLF
jgi:TPR repeat protein